jgi:hypothetical protein
MKKDEFIQSCYLQLLTVFQKAKRHQKDMKQKYRLEGYIHAGKIIGLITDEEAVIIMNNAHLEVFSETIESRKNRKASMREAIERGDDDYINIPAYERESK